MTDCPSTIRLVPHQQPVVWGGQQLHALLNKAAAPGPIGESWEVWEGDPVESGALAGTSLEELCRRFPHELVGPSALQSGANRFPLLTKFIDAQQPLSVQVHPNDVQAQRLEDQPNGKTEAWHIIQAEPDAWLIHGLNQPIEAAEFRSRLEAGTADPLLRKIPARKGDTIFVPARTVHAIGPGVLLHEIQQASTTTYRLYDWNRTENGLARELHLDKGLEVAFLAPQPQPVVSPLEWKEAQSEIALILACEYFTVKKVTLRGVVDVRTFGRSFHIVTLLSGDCSATIEEGVTANLSAGQSLVISAHADRYRLMTEGEALACIEYVASISEEVMPELRERIHDVPAVGAFLAQFMALV